MKLVSFSLLSVYLCLCLCLSLCVCLSLSVSLSCSLYHYLSLSLSSLHSPPSIRHVFWHMAASMGLIYTAYPLAHATWSSKSVHVDPSSLIHMLRASGAL